MMNYNNNTAMRSNITRMILTPSRTTYQDVYKRSYELSVRPSDLIHLENVFNHSNVHRNQSLNDHTIANSIPNIMNISNHTTGRVEVPYGWGTQRLQFMMEVETDVGDKIVTSYVQGFSEYHDPSFSGRLDDKMLFYINSIVTVNKMYDPITGQLVIRPSYSYNVVTDLAGGVKYQEVDMFGNPTDTLKLIRPVDIIDDIGLSDMYSGLEDNVINTTGDVNSKINKANISRRGNSDPIKYFTSTINSVIKSKSLSETSYDTKDVIRQAGSIVAEEQYMYNPFIYDLYTMTGEFSPTTFTTGVLERITPHLVPQYGMGSNAVGIMDPKFAMLDSDYTAGMLQPTLETKLATVIAHSMTAMMTDNMITNIMVSFTNVTGQPIVIIPPAKSFIEGIDITMYQNRIQHRIEQILLPEVTNGGQTIIECNLEADLLGDTSISIALNMQPPMLFRFPTFTDSLYTPVISDAASRAGLVEDFENVIDKTYASNAY